MPLRRGAAGPGDFRYRPADDADEPFLSALYASTRADEPGLSEWPEAIRKTFLDQQHRARQIQYRSVYPNAERLIVLRLERAIGLIAIDHGEDAIRLIDIALVDGERGIGLGTAIMADLFETSRESDKPIRLSVQFDSKARRFYERLGFRTIADDETYLTMERSASGREPQAS